jgi:leucine dehydrogenase
MVYDKIKLIQDQSPNIKVVKPNEVYKEKCDIFLSCAENNLIGAEEVSQLNCKVLTGSTNDILANPEIENNLKDKKIMFVPGFIINGGELIQLDNEFKGKDPEVIDIEIAEIYNSVTNLLELAETKQKSLTQVAIEEAQNYINAVASIKKLK